MAKNKIRDVVISIRCNKQERAYIDYLAEELQRTRGDAIRFIIRKTVEDMREDKRIKNG